MAPLPKKVVYQDVVYNKREGTITLSPIGLSFRSADHATTADELVYSLRWETITKCTLNKKTAARAMIKLTQKGFDNEPPPTATFVLADRGTLEDLRDHVTARIGPPKFKETMPDSSMNTAATTRMPDASTRTNNTTTKKKTLDASTRTSTSTRRTKDHDRERRKSARRRSSQARQDEEEEETNQYSKTGLTIEFGNASLSTARSSLHSVTEAMYRNLEKEIQPPEQAPKQESFQDEPEDDCPPITELDTSSPMEPEDLEDPSMTTQRVGAMPDRSDPAMGESSQTRRRRGNTDEEEEDAAPLEDEEPPVALKDVFLVPGIRCIFGTIAGCFVLVIVLLLVALITVTASDNDGEDGATTTTTTVATTGDGATETTQVTVLAPPKAEGNPTPFIAFMLVMVSLALVAFVPTFLFYMKKKLKNEQGKTGERRASLRMEAGSSHHRV